MSQGSVKEISVVELDKLAKAGKVHVIDVRTNEEYDEVHAAIVTKLMPLQEFDPSEMAIDKNDDIYFICRSGARSFQAASQALAMGFENVFNVQGGTLAWIAANLETKKS